MRVTTLLLGGLLWAAVIGLPAVPISHTVVIDVNDRAPNFFSPDVARVNVGDTVVFSLSHNHHTGAGHTVTSLAGPDSFDSGVIHWSYKWTPTIAGEYTYICEIHPYMKGIIAVGQEPTVAHAIVGEGAKDGVWPPDVTPLPAPTTPGVGEIWVDLQWYDKPGLPDEPGAVAVVDATTWQVTKVLPFGNNPHNLGASPDLRYVYQTSWHGDQLGIYDRLEDRWVKTLDVGSAPAHVVTAPNGDAFVTLNAENFLAVIDPVTFAVKQHINFQGKGPHGVWLDKSGSVGVAALTLSSQAAIFDPHSGQVLAELPASRLPLAASVTADGLKAYVPGALGGSITVIDVPSLSVVKTIDKVGKMLIQVPFTPDDQLAVQASTGDAGVIVIDAVHDEVLKRIKTHPGAHGVAIGDKAGGGWYAYVTHKYADVLTVIDMDTLEVAGEIKMPAAGGNGIAALPGAHLASELPATSAGGR
jgi:DNA-binding beta-propeller fold protein YncE/plastocyanin